MTSSAKTRWIGGLALIVFLLVVCAIGVQILGRSGHATFRSMQDAVAGGDFEQALTIADQLVENKDEDVDYLVLAGQLASDAGEYERAIRYYSLVPDTAGRTAADARWSEGEIWLHLGHVVPAERCYRHAIAIEPGHEMALESLAIVLSKCGRRWEAKEYLFELIRSDRLSVDRLLLIGNTEMLIGQRAELEQYLDVAPKDLLPNLALARIALENGSPHDAIMWLEALLKSAPDLVEAHVQLGFAKLQLGELDYETWAPRLPASAPKHPDIWFLKGEIASRLSNLEGAVRCFLETISIDPNHVMAHNRLAQLLGQRGDDDRAALCARRAERLDQLAIVLDTLFQNPNDEVQMRRAAELTAELGRFWESQGWYGACLWRNEKASWALEAATAVGQKIQGSTSQTSQTHTVASRFSLNDFPLPSFGSGSDTEATGGFATSLPPSMPPADVQFKDVASEMGVDFTYFPSRKGPTNAHRMYEFTGGGVGVLDLENDGWPDLVFTQGSTWPPTSTDQSRIDQLFRNVDGKAFVNVTLQSRIRGVGYSQGVAVADINDDGFDDLYIANIGRNELYVNNGDGTFDRVVDDALDLERWTTSCAVADLNGDGFPDIYDANYVTGNKVFEYRCNVGGLPRACSPLEFHPESDCLLVNLGNGQFDDVSESVGLPKYAGNGLGVVVARLGEQRRTSVFVANDQVPNSLLVRAKSSDRSEMQFDDRAVVQGIAFDRSGRAQACMGIAASDADNDGNVDLFVTNFFDDANTLYRQTQHETFSDISVFSGLAASSMKTLGFGTQFVDVQLDGWPDLFIVNGHIDDMTHLGIPYQMKPQLFINHGNAKFEPANAGKYFDQRRLGRAVASLDLNRDGRADLAATHLNSPVALLENRTASVGQHVSVRFVGVASGRDTIGAIVHLHFNGCKLTRQLTAGDGYMACNERVLVVGVGQADAVDRFVVEWPSGQHDEFGSVRSGSEVLLIEGRENPVILTVGK